MRSRPKGSKKCPDCSRFHMPGSACEKPGALGPREPLPQRHPAINATPAEQRAIARADVALAELGTNAEQLRLQAAAERRAVLAISTAVVVDHAPGCPNDWHLKVYGGRKELSGSCDCPTEPAIRFAEAKSRHAHMRRVAGCAKCDALHEGREAFCQNSVGATQKAALPNGYVVTRRLVNFEDNRETLNAAAFRAAARSRMAAAAAEQRAKKLRQARRGNNNMEDNDNGTA